MLVNLPGSILGEVRLAPRLETDTLDCRQRPRRDVHRQPGDADDERQHEPRQRPIDTGGADATGHHRRHLAVRVQPAQRQHDRQEQPDRHQDGQVLQGGQPNYLKYRVFWQLVLRDLAQHPGKLVGEQDEQQDRRYRQPGLRYLAKDVTVKYAKHGETRIFERFPLEIPG
ncbi:MAG: hypothetical protein U5K76_06760 [Woeseiaceae bacterium]|nr:hypothetical protein [Woeseiaceae bacterium]